jgi:mannan endo-1,6-alpha-mannosidase
VRDISTICHDLINEDSIRSVAKNLTGGIVGLYKRGLQAYNVPGLFYDPITVLREPYYWWEAGAVFGGLIEYSHLTGDDQYSELIGTALGWQMGAYDFMPENQTKTLGNDDQSFWGLAAMTAAETGLVAPNDVGEWADLAINVFNTQVERWNTETCGGGLNWQIFSFNNGYSYKNSISTGNFFLLSARLAKFTGNTTYSDWAQKAMDWSQDVGLISDDYAVYDGAQDTSNCSQINRIQWTENSAIFAEGAALMYNLVSLVASTPHSTSHWN